MGLRVLEVKNPPTASKNELARQIKYLKVENEILRSKLPARITVTTKERSRLVRFAKKLGTAIYGLATIVTPQTVMRWLKDDREGKNHTPVKRGRRRTAQEICLLVVRPARENSWGYTRILGEIRKLGIKSNSRNTVKRILAEHGFDPGPTRREGSWDEFLKRHAASLWQCDFFSQNTVTFQGIREAFVLASPCAQPSSNKISLERAPQTLELAAFAEFEFDSVAENQIQPATKPASRS